MARHKYQIGDRVAYVRDRHDGDVTPGAYTITRLMPLDGLEPRYHVKSATDAHERSMKESQLRKV